MKTLFYSGILLALLCTNLFAQSSRPKPEPGLHVTIVLFSGREDPKLVITDAREIADVFNAIRGLPDHASLSSTSSLPLPMFGFRGIIIQNFSNVSSEMSIIHVFKNAVEIIGRAAPAARDVKSFRVDSAGALQQRFVSMALSRGVIPRE